MIARAAKLVSRRSVASQTRGALRELGETRVGGSYKFDGERIVVAVWETATEAARKSRKPNPRARESYVLRRKKRFFRRTRWGEFV